MKEYVTIFKYPEYKSTKIRRICKNISSFKMIFLQNMKECVNIFQISGLYLLLQKIKEFIKHFKFPDYTYSKYERICLTIQISR